MSNEFKLLKDIATISATLAELQAVDTLITDEIASEQFLSEYNSLLFDVLNTYRALNIMLNPLLGIQSSEAFHRDFAPAATTFSDNFQSVLSESRINAEHTFQKYLQFRKRRETKTSYPSLRRAFPRLHAFIDKWIDNDIWLALTLDSLLKRLNRMLAELLDTAAKDPEQAYQLFCSFSLALNTYANMLSLSLEAIDSRRQATALDTAGQTQHTSLIASP